MCTLWSSSCVLNVFRMQFFLSLCSFSSLKSFSPTPKNVANLSFDYHVGVQKMTVSILTKSLRYFISKELVGFHSSYTFTYISIQALQLHALPMSYFHQRIMFKFKLIPCCLSLFVENL